MRRTTEKSAFILSLVCTAALAAFNSNGQNGVVRTMTAEPSGPARMKLGLGANFAVASDYVETRQDQEGSAAKMFSSNVVWSIGAGRQVDLALAFPFYADWAGFRETSDFGLGDLELSTKVLLAPYKEKGIVYPALFLGVGTPTGQITRDRKGIFPRVPAYYGSDVADDGYFYSSRLPYLKPGFLLTFDTRHASEGVQFRIHTNLGSTISLDKNLSKTLIGGLGLEVAPVEVVTLFTDVHLETRTGNLKGANLLNDALMISPGLRVDAPVGVYMIIAADFAVSSGKTPWTEREQHPDGRRDYTTRGWPKWGFQFKFGWQGFLSAQDGDKDGVKDDVDRCPKDPEDVDGFEDSDGCPDPDNDNDGVPDARDKCPNEEEDKDGIEDDDGCPDLDNDGDGIADLEDQCPRMAEDFDGIQDKDGCPDPDNDKDGIPDSLDKCPNDPEDVDKFEDDDGCPDIDNDKDNIPDLKDKCPNQPETLNGLDDEDGCPDKKETKQEPPMPKHQVVKGINFKSGSIQMTFDSYQYLDPIIKVLREYPVVEIEVRGHTDSVGNYETNMRLSKLRAEAVRQHLIAQGITPERIRAVGFGPSSPIADNRTAEGRTRNRRIEVVRIK